METIDALEAVRRLTMERDALANELDAVKDDFRVSRQTLDSIRAATGLQNYGHHLAESLKAMKEDRDALAEQVKRLEADALQAPVRQEQPETGAESQTCDGCKHGRHSLCDKMVCTRHAPKHGERMGERGFWPLVSREDTCGDWEGKA